MGIEAQLWRHVSGSGDGLRWVLHGDNWWAGAGGWKNRKRIQNNRNSKRTKDERMEQLSP